MANSRDFAIIPAAGKSRRMGAKKLMLEWDGKPLIWHALQAWLDSKVSNVVIVVRDDDEELIACCDSYPITIVRAKAPPDMRASVEAGLDWLRQNLSPSIETDSWLLAPADTPRMNSRWIDSLLNTKWKPNTPIQVACYLGKRGHPVRFRWSLASEVSKLPANVGLNHLLQQFAVQEIEVPDPLILEDIDTPIDYQQLSSDARPEDEDEKDQTD